MHTSVLERWWPMPCDNSIAIRLENVTKRYRLYKNEKARFLSMFDKRIPYEDIYANKNLSFEIPRGQAVSFLGRNGAGKSTALKLISGVLQPTEGTVEVNGRVSAMLELTAGFDAQLTGRENLNMRGYLWGFKRPEMVELMDSIIEFAELGSFIDQPVRTYSSGMKSRLGFAFASSIQPDILVVDEALSVGDKKFSAKCLDRMKEIMSQEDMTLLFVTHSTSSAQEFCTRGLVLDKGQLCFDGPIDEAVEYYDAMD